MIVSFTSNIQQEGKEKKIKNLWGVCMFLVKQILRKKVCVERNDSPTTRDRVGKTIGVKYDQGK
jgi:hypothetical protein